MNSADFLDSTIITLKSRISLGHTLGFFQHSLSAYIIIFLCVHDCRVDNTALVVDNNYRDCLLHIEPFRHFVTKYVLLAATKIGFTPISPMHCQAHLFCTRPGNVFTVVQLTYHYQRFQLQAGEFQPAIRTGTGFDGICSVSRLGCPLYRPLQRVCSPRRKGNNDLTSSPPSSPLPGQSDQKNSTKHKGCAR